MRFKAQKIEVYNFHKRQSKHIYEAFQSISNGK